MRTREEIEKEYKGYPINEYADQQRILEVLLDIRDILNKQVK